MLIVVSYDIKDDRRRMRVHKILKDYGQWMQYSVFECRIDRSTYLRLRARLEEVINLAAGDSVCFYFLREEDAGRIERLGGGKPLSEVAVFVGFDGDEKEKVFDK
ncbi:MAG: CRISPR-associated endonuclease Cas2 [Clostridia bacterium]|nr:CRISPR-associated endonuclease Cas2 [Clostridia bacterium]